MAKRIDAKNLNIFYGKFHAVKDVQLTIAPRSVTAFIGPSGCGKSTVLRTLNRMHEVIPGARVEGTIELDGQDIYASTMDPVAVRRTIGMVFQRPNPFPTMSIYDNVVAGMKLQGGRVSKAETDNVVEKSLRGANLWEEVKDRLGKPGMGLSGGQQQRLCIARAIAVEPQVLLMDEPCSALDPISTLAIEDLIQELKEKYTIVIVTHNMQQAARVSEKTAFFTLSGAGKPGELVEMDDTDKIFSKPRPEAHRGLHQRPLRLNRPAPAPATAGPRDDGRPAVALSRARVGRLVRMIGAILGLALLGLVAGAIARLFVRSPARLGCLGTMLLGVAGSYLGGTLAALLFDEEFNIRRTSTVLGAIVGTVVLLGLWRLIDNGKREP